MNDEKALGMRRLKLNIVEKALVDISEGARRLVIRRLSALLAIKRWCHTNIHLQHKNVSPAIGEDVKGARKIRYMQVGSTRIGVDAIDGMCGYHLCDMSVWSQEVASAIARLEGVNLGPQHWATIRSLRKYYNEYQIVPSVRVFRAAQKRMNLELKLELLFPKGINQACGIAGLPYPTCYGGWN